MSLSSSPLQRLLIVLALVVLWWAPLLSDRPLARPDEARYGEIAREMAVTGDYVTPRLNGIQYFEKPPLQYWATAVSFKLFGVHEWSARLWTTLAGFLTLLFAAGIASDLRRSPLLAALVTGSVFYVALLGHINTLDSGLTAFMTGALWAFLRAKRSSRSARWMMISGVFTGLAILSKGPVALVIPGFAMFIDILVHRSLAVFRKTHLVLFLLSILLIAAPWFVLCSLHNPGFAHFFFIHEHLERFTSEVHQRVEPAWYFIPVLLLGLLPWTLQLPSAVLRGFNDGLHFSGFKPQRFLVIYAASVLIFFSLSGSKLPTYIFPAFPALAVLIAAESETRPHPKLIAMTAFGFGALLAFSAALFRFPEIGAFLHLHPDLDPDMVMPYARLALWLGSAGLVLMASGILYAMKSGSAITLIALASLLAADLGLFGAKELSAFNSVSPWINTWKSEVKADSRLFSVRTYEQSLPFYLGRTVTLVEFEDELGPGLKTEPSLAIGSFEAFARTWGTGTQDLAIMEPHTLEDFRMHHLAYRIVAQDSRHVVVSAR